MRSAVVQDLLQTPLTELLNTCDASLATDNAEPLHLSQVMSFFYDVWQIELRYCSILFGMNNKIYYLCSHEDNSKATVY